MALSGWRENFSSGVSFIRRRFSSNDLQADDERHAAAADADTTGLNFNLPRSQRGRSRPSPSAPSSPSKSSSSGYGAFARGLFSAAAGGGQRQAYNKDRCKTLLIIDEPHVDWSVYHFISPEMRIKPATHGPTMTADNHGSCVAGFTCGNFPFLTWMKKEEKGGKGAGENGRGAREKRREATKQIYPRAHSTA